MHCVAERGIVRPRDIEPLRMITSFIIHYPTKCLAPAEVCRADIQVNRHQNCKLNRRRLHAVCEALLRPSSAPEVEGAWRYTGILIHYIITERMAHIGCETHGSGDGKSPSIMLNVAKREG
jgi:hypothetical protein